jgi:hypothetical protein
MRRTDKVFLETFHFIRRVVNPQKAVFFYMVPASFFVL